MRKKIISILFISMLNMSFAEGGFFFFDSSKEIESQRVEEQKKIEMEKKWEKIKIYEKQISFEKDKEKLKKIHDEYEKEFAEYLDYVKEDTERLFSLGDYYFKDNRYEKAYEIFSQDKTNIKNVFGAATTARFLNNLDISLTLYNQTIGMAPNFYEAYLGRGIVNRNLGRYNEAISDFNNYLKFKQDEQVYIGLGDTYMISENYEEARRILEVARNRYPNSKIIKDMLIRVYARVK